jgi:pyruvate,water dikinase
MGSTKVLTRNIEVPVLERRVVCISDDEALELAGYAVIIEDYYSK